MQDVTLKYLISAGHLVLDKSYLRIQEGLYTMSCNYAWVSNTTELNSYGGRRQMWVMWQVTGHQVDRYSFVYSYLVIGTGNLQVFWVSDVVGLLPRIFWIFWAKHHPNWLRMDWVMVQNWFEASSFKTDVTAPVNVSKNDQKTRSSSVTGFLSIFCDIYRCCDISLEARGLKSILDHNSVNS